MFLSAIGRQTYGIHHPKGRLNVPAKTSDWKPKYLSAFVMGSVSYHRHVGHVVLLANRRFGDIIIGRDSVCIGFGTYILNVSKHASADVSTLVFDDITDVDKKVVCLWYVSINKTSTWRRRHFENGHPPIPAFSSLSWPGDIGRHSASIGVIQVAQREGRDKGANTVRSLPLCQAIA